jgi:hypothetical protein
MSTCDEPVFAQSTQKTSGCDFENEALYELEGGGYCPVQPLPHDHGVTMFPLAPQNEERIDRHFLQVSGVQDRRIASLYFFHVVGD